MMRDRDINQYQALTTPTKLRGGYYTPDALVALILDRLELRPDDWILDPSCGDGSFLRGAVAALAALAAPGSRLLAPGVQGPGQEPGAASQEPPLSREPGAGSPEYWAKRIFGFDIDTAAVESAREGVRDAFAEQFGVRLPPDAVQVHRADVLACSRLQDLLSAVGAPGSGSAGRLLIVGNPPYVEAKRLGREAKAALRERFPEAVVGAPDLYLYFLHLCLGWLREGDELAFVLPNKVLVNANARSVRERLLDEGRLRGLWLATKAGIFDGAAVYPVVLFAGGAKDSSKLQAPSSKLGKAAARCRAASRRPSPGAWSLKPGAVVEIVPLARSTNGEIVPGEGSAVDPTLFRRTRASAFFPVPEAPALEGALERLLAARVDARLDALLDIRWTVSFHRAGLRERFVTKARPDGGSARRFLGGGPFLGNGEVTRYRIEWAGWWIRYDTEMLKAERNPLPDPALFERPKIVLCQNGRTLRAAYDDRGFVLKDTFLCGAIRPIDHPLCRHPRALVGLLCSRAVHFFYAHVFYGGHVNGGYLHFLRSFLIDVPIGTWTEAMAEEVAALVRRRAQASTPEEQAALEEQIEARVGTALGLTPEEQAAIAAWAAEDANWQARERVRAPAGVARGS